MRQEIEGKQIGNIKVIRKQFNPNVKCKPNDYYLVEVKGKQKLMRYDSIIKSKLNTINNGLVYNKEELTPKEIIFEKINTQDDIGLSALMLIISMDITNAQKALEKCYPRTYHAKLHQYIREYMNTEKFSNKENKL